MSFTAVVTHATGDVFPASDWNTYVRDNLAWVHGRLDPVISGTKTSSVTTTGTTFAGGADLLASALAFTADGTSSYLLLVTARAWSSSTTAGTALLNINLDGADRGQFAQTGQPAIASSGLTLCAIGEILTPAAGAHTVNARVFMNVAGTATVVGGVGGAGADVPIVLSLLAL